MSLAGLGTYKANLDRMMSSEAFKRADDAERLEMGYRLLNSRYGLGTLPGIGGGIISFLAGLYDGVKRLGKG
ncbi:hypothetical protein KAR91_88460 [Candidatus Pacearchaeota archaeon]|nr:hypothetical protein [Candidatus Pacearchaeota archaeon]